MAKGRKTETPSSNGSENEMIATVRGLAAVVTEHSLSELIVDKDGTTITLRRGAISVPVQMHASQPVHHVTHHAPASMSHAHHEASAPAPVAAPINDKSHVVTSPFVGTFYRRPNPDSPNYVELNERVEKGQVLCIVEAMKLMNEIEADVSGTVLAVLAEDGSPVEYGQPLFKIVP
jgi:acetyl-CoA carboxylase biotin carboxyl carrier protein